MESEPIGIIGLGVMGGGIAQFFAEHDRQVLAWDVDAAAVERGMSGIRKRLEKSAKKGTIAPKRAAEVLARITPLDTLDNIAHAGLLIEAVVESFAAKRALFDRISSVVADETIVATNTSSLSVTELSACCRNAARFLGLHFFNPPTRLELVEVVPTAVTSSAVIDRATALLRDCGKTPVIVKDAPGFIVNRLLLLMINEAARMVDQGIATADDIDTAMRLGALHPAGPLAVADLIGLDTCDAILRILHQGLGESSYEPADAIVDRVRDGKLGRKTGEGFHTK